MKKRLSITLSVVLFLSLTIPAYAVNPPTATEEKISTIYGIPHSVIETLPADILSSLEEGVQDIDKYSSQVTYAKVSYTNSGETTVSPAGYDEYLMATRVNDTDNNDWMKIVTAIVDKGSYAQVSASYTWLTRPTFRMTDVIGLAVAQGTIEDDSADGFYSYTTSQGTFTTDFSDTPLVFDYRTYGIIRQVPLATPDYPVTRDFFFIRANIYKEGTSEGLGAAYAHRRLSLVFNPSFNISNQGILSCAGFTIGLGYDQFNGYVSTVW